MEDEDDDDDWNPENISQALLNQTIVKFKCKFSIITNILIEETNQFEFSKKIDNTDNKDEEDDDDQFDLADCPFDFKSFNTLKDKKQTYDDLMYHPAEDENNQIWV